MSQTVDEDVIFDDVYELCEVIGRLAETTHADKYCYLLMTFNGFYWQFINFNMEKDC